MSDELQPLTVRLPASVLEELAERSKADGLNLSALVRRLVTDALGDIDKTEELRAEFVEIRRGVDLLRENLSNVALVLLTQAEPYSLEEAQAWVLKNILERRRREGAKVHAVP